MLAKVDGLDGTGLSKPSPSDTEHGMMVSYVDLCFLMRCFFKFVVEPPFTEYKELHRSHFALSSLACVKKTHSLLFFFVPCSKQIDL